MSYWYYVIDYRTGATRYKGRSETKAAIALEPGTVYGQSTTEFNAELQANQRMQAARRSLKESE